MISVQRKRRCGRPSLLGLFLCLFLAWIKHRVRCFVLEPQKWQASRNGKHISKECQFSSSRENSDLDLNLQSPSSPSSSSPSVPSIMTMDPLISSILLWGDQSSDTEDDNNADNHDDKDYSEMSTKRNVTDLLAASHGLQVWRSSLSKGCLPTVVDFETTNGVWPPHPVFQPLVQSMTDLQFPRFVLNHPELMGTVLRQLWRLVQTFEQKCQVMVQDKIEEEAAVEEEEAEEDDYWDNLLEDRWTDYKEEEDDKNNPDNMEHEMALSAEEKEELAQDIVQELVTDAWSGVIGGVQALDQLLGRGHGLLSNDNEQETTGFGWNDGIWQHAGWKILPQVQRELLQMPEVRGLMQQLGRRPTAEQSDAMRKFLPRKQHPKGALGAEFDPSLRSSIQGITLSGNLAEMLPSEALLLVDRKRKSNNDVNGTVSASKQSTSSAFRRLFLAKLAENKLVSYESAGWQDVPSVVRPKSRYQTRLPSAPGGPILVCLDTSWSMTGRREILSKAVVVASVMAAHQQQRDIQVIAFSSASNVMETGRLTADPAGMQSLLEFLSCSFGGGTDVTGALKHAMMAITEGKTNNDNDTAISDDEQENRTHDSPQQLVDDINRMASADILLVTDGELPNPPVSDEVMQSLGKLKQQAGVQVHGLLVGKRDSVPLAKLCTHVHDFLIGYDTPIPTIIGNKINSNRFYSRAMLRATSEISLARNNRGKQSRHSAWNPLSHFGNVRRSSLNAKSALFGRYSKFDDLLDDDDDWGNRGRKRYKAGAKKKKYGAYDGNNDGSSLQPQQRQDREATAVVSSTNNNAIKEVEEITRTLIDDVEQSIREDSWQVAALDKEKNSEHSCWRYRGELQKAVERVAEGLVERDEEARLVVLGMVAEEHVLFLGPPGTAKSVLGRRLSTVCGGTFFQRLLTRFTTPEEIFGPLSLRALENDEYRRKTDGFLPTATVAFLDEIFKANSAILNTLLTILNERQFDNGAGRREDCPIRCVVGASNELPESDELDALYDRFLLRKSVMPVSDEGLLRLLGMQTPGSSPCDNDSSVGQTDGDNGAMCEAVFTESLDELIKSISIAADNSVTLDADTGALLRDLRSFLRDEMDVDISDRRLVKAARLLKVSAACHGRSKVDPLDCLLLQHILWRLPEERDAVRTWLWNHITPGSSGLASSTLEDESLESAAMSSVKQFRLLINGLRNEAIEAVRKTSGDISGASGARQPDIEVIQRLSGEAGAISDLLLQRLKKLARHTELVGRAKDHLWLNPDEAQSAQQLLFPRAEAYQRATQHILRDARSLEWALMPEKARIGDSARLSVLENLWDEDDGDIAFSEVALAMSMKEAKAKYDSETFRAWKRARKKNSI